MVGGDGREGRIRVRTNNIPPLHNHLCYSLERKKIEDKGAKNLAEALKTNKTVKRLE